MKGVVFTEFLQMVESRFGADVADGLFEAGGLASGGAYTAVGAYDAGELVLLVGRLSERVGMPAAALVRAFGRYLFGRFAVLYPGLFAGVASAFDFLDRVDGVIHVEVRKLHPQASLPRFETRRTGHGGMEMIYRSQNPFADLAEGLIEGCGEHFGEAIGIRWEPLEGPEGHAVRFILTTRAAVPA
jgi:hypothetical protein